MRPDNPHVVLVLTSTPVDAGEPALDAGAGCASSPIDAGIGDSGVGYANEIFESTDDGAHWTAFGTSISSTAAMTTIEVAASDPHRVYVSGYRLDGDLRDPILFVSIDDGADWTERPTPPLDSTTEAEVYIAAVNPTDADRVYLRTGGLGASRLFVTSNAGMSFRVPLTLTRQMLGFALSPDGSRVYAGGPNDGLYVAQRSTLSFQRVSPVSVECLTAHGSDLWACSVEGPSGFIAGVSRDDGASFAAAIHLNGIQAPLSCSPDAAAAACSGGAFQQLCQSFGCGGKADSGAADASAASSGDAGADGGSPTPSVPRPPRPSCGCSVAVGEGAAGFAALGALAAGAAGRRARRPKRDGRRAAVTSPRPASPRRGCP